MTRRQRPLRALRADDFRLSEAGESRSISALQDQELPLDVVVVFHVVPKNGNKMHDLMVARLQNGAANLLIPTRPEDRVAFITHTAQPHIVLPFTNDRSAMAAAIRRFAAMQENGGFSELLTIEYVTRMLAEVTHDDPRARVDRRRLIVLFRAPLGAGLGYADDSIIRRLWEENIIFSTIDIWQPDEGFNPGISVASGPRLVWGVEPDHALFRVSNPIHIAQATGGDGIIYLNPQDPQDLVTRLRQRYTLWFDQPEGVAPGEVRTISVELSPEMRAKYPDAVVHARQGYVTK